jgi:hypothetical protein
MRSSDTDPMAASETACLRMAADLLDPSDPLDPTATDRRILCSRLRALADAIDQRDPYRGKHPPPSPRSSTPRPADEAPCYPAPRIIRGEIIA